MARAGYIAAALACALLISSCPRAAEAGAQDTYTPPVDAPVSDPFRAPPTRFGPGNRGLEYATEPGEAVTAAAAGEVIFSGLVAGTRHVTVLHPDGLRTSYSFLAEIGVVVGQRLRGGDTIGVAGDRLHFGVRDPDDNYLDPALLFGGDGHGRARLIPGVEEGRAALARSERNALLAFVLDQAGGQLRRGRLALHYAVELRSDVRVAHVIEDLARLRFQQRSCTSPSEPPPALPGRRVAVLVGGLGSTSRRAAVDDVDTPALGFAPADVVRFSYAGGRVPDDTDDPAFSGIVATDYAAVATTDGLEVAAARLSELLSELARARPGVPIDVIAHSQGGLVARLAIASAARDGWLPSEVSTLATLATPHQGADLATAAELARRWPEPPLVAALARDAGYDPAAASTRDLSEVAPLVDHLGDVPLPAHLARVSIAARGDLVVPVPRTMDHAFPTAVVAVGGVHAHDDLPGATSVTRELALAIGGRPPTCAGFAEQLADVVAGEAVSWATDELAVATVAAG